MCLDIPFTTCGAGTCVNGTCVCDKGWSQNLDFFYGTTTGTEFCDYNELLVTCFCIALLMITISYMLLQLYVIETRSQFRRLIPILIGFLLFAINVGIRLDRIDEDLFGRDALYTFTWAFCAAFLGAQTTIFLNKYIEYMLKQFDLNSTTKRFSEITTKTQYVIVFGFFAAATLFFVSTFVELETAEILVKVGGGLLAALNTALGINSTVLFTKYIHDLQTVVDNANQKQVVTAVKFVERCKKNIPRTRTVRLIFLTGNIWGLVFNGVALVSDGWLKLWSYFLYIHFLMYTMGAFAAILAAGRLRNNKNFAAFASFRFIFTDFTSKEPESGRGTGTLMTRLTGSGAKDTKDSSEKGKGSASMSI